jgi:hypothetical protein
MEVNFSDLVNFDDDDAKTFLEMLEGIDDNNVSPSTDGVSDTDRKSCDLDKIEDALGGTERTCVLWGQSDEANDTSRCCMRTRNLKYCDLGEDFRKMKVEAKRISDRLQRRRALNKLSAFESRQRHKNELIKLREYLPLLSEENNKLSLNNEVLSLCLHKMLSRLEGESSGLAVDLVAIISEFDLSGATV